MIDWHGPATTVTHVHPWEKVGLGRAPFRWLGVSHEVGPKVISHEGGVTFSVGAPGQPMGSCAYCGQGIAEVHRIRSADGKEFTVGCDCVRRVNEPGSRVLTDAERAHRDLANKIARARARVKARISKTQVSDLLADPRIRGLLEAQHSAYAWKAEQGGTALDDAEWVASHAGHSGRVKLIKQIDAMSMTTTITAVRNAVAGVKQ